jgi:uncharacterized membrane protein
MTLMLIVVFYLNSLVFIKYNHCDENHTLNSIDSYLINGYDWFNYEYSMVLNYLMNNEHKEKLDLSNLLNYCIGGNQLGIASGLALFTVLHDNTLFTALNLRNH